MDDRTMLELAAKAAGVNPIEIDYQDEFVWDPLTDDGDALRLAIDLQLGISIPPVVDGRVEVVTFYGPIISVIEYPVSGDRHAATRRAITRAAAEIQLSKESGK
jgi:hypothetical protein